MRMCFKGCVTQTASIHKDRHIAFHIVVLRYSAFVIVLYRLAAQGQLRYLQSLPDIAPLQSANEFGNNRASCSTSICDSNIKGSCTRKVCWMLTLLTSLMGSVRR